MLSNLWSRAYVLLTATAICWAGNAIVGRAAREFVPPIALSFWRWLLALALILPFALPHLRRDWPKLKASWRVMLPMGVLGIGSFNTLLYSGLQSTTAMNGLLIQAAQPAVILLLGALMMRDQIGRWQVAGLILSLIGVATILTRGQVQMLLSLNFNQGDAIIAAALIVWGIYSVLLRKRPDVHPLSFFAATLCIGVTAISPFYAAEYLSGQRVSMTWESSMAILYVGIFPSVIAYMFFNRGVELLGSGQAGLFMNIMPVIGAALAVLLLGEALRSFHLIGLLMVLAGIALARRGAT